MAGRRTPGLRREELASAAGITHSWLVKLEQGQARSVSQEVLGALARALMLDRAERTHLFALAGYRADERPDDPPVGDTEVTPALRSLLDRLEPSPAYLLNRRWDIVAWNGAEERLFPHLADYGDTRPNLVELVFLDADLAELMADHADEQVRLVSQFRFHAADWPDDVATAGLVDGLRRRSDRFRTLWDAKDVLPFATTRRIFDHPIDGRIELDHHRLAVLDQPGMQLVVYTPRT